MPFDSAGGAFRSYETAWHALWSTRHLILLLIKKAKCLIIAPEGAFRSYETP